MKKGEKESAVAKEKNRLAHLGKRLSDETKEKISLSNKGIKKSEEHKRKMSIAAKNRKRERMSNETKIKMRISHLGSKSHFWRGGVSSNPYSVDWNKTLKRSIRERDRYTCFICKKEPALDCHHIDYNKLNCNPNNLITLCRHCHMKTNTNREYWTKYFENLIN
jgi:5-methylcytosine-specific restriction endonuclease McrA